MKRRKAWKGSSIAIAALLAMLWAGDALAATKYLAPLLDKGDGSIECTNCCTGSSLDTGKLIIGGSGSAISALANNATATTMYMTNASGLNSGTPYWRAPSILDLGTGSLTASDLSTALAAASETGTAGKVVFDTGPTISNITLSGSFTGTSITAPLALPADAFDDITDFKSTIKSGGANAGAGALLVTKASGAATGCATWNANGNLEGTGGACGGGSIAVSLDISPMTQVTASTTPVYCGMDGSCSTTETDVHTPFHHSTSATYTDMIAQTTGAPGVAVTVALGVGTCGGALNYTTKSQYVTGTTAWSAGTPTGTTTVANGECAALKITAGSTATKTAYRISIKQTAGT